MPPIIILPHYLERDGVGSTLSLFHGSRILLLSLTDPHPSTAAHSPLYKNIHACIETRLDQHVRQCLQFLQSFKALDQISLKERPKLPDERVLPFPILCTPLLLFSVLVKLLHPNSFRRNNSLIVYVLPWGSEISERYSQIPSISSWHIFFYPPNTILPTPAKQQTNQSNDKGSNNNKQSRVTQTN